MEIRSYRTVFDLERRVYSIDRLRLNPGGVPVRGIVYFLAILAATMLASWLPLLGAALRALPWYAREIVLPGASATVLGSIRIEGRTFHLAASAIVRHALAARRLTALERRAQVGRRWFPGEILLLPDGSDARMRRLLYTGPGAVLVTIEHELARPARIRSRSRSRPWRTSRRGLELRQGSGGGILDEGQVIALAPLARLLVSGLESRPRWRWRWRSASR